MLRLLALALLIVPTVAQASERDTQGLPAGGVRFATEVSTGDPAQSRFIIGEVGAQA